jgi:hypothetical protein
MPIDFPTSPTNGQIYTYEGRSWIYNGTAWDAPRALNEVGAVRTFADAAGRTAAIPSPSEGTVSYLNDSNILSIYNGSVWKNSVRATGGVLQVVSTTKTDTFTMSSNTFSDITGLTAVITPTSTSSSILVMSTLILTQNVAVNNGFGRLARNGTAIGIADAAGSRTRSIFNINSSNGDQPYLASISYLDSPASTSALTYSVQIANNGSGSIWINRSVNDTDATFQARYSSTITVMEIAG